MEDTRVIHIWGHRSPLFTQMSSVFMPALHFVIWVHDTASDSLHILQGA